jgi:hypothetical protein
MVRLVEVVLEPGKRTCPPLATPAGASRLRCVPPPRLHRGGGAGGITPLQGTPASLRPQGLRSPSGDIGNSRDKGPAQLPTDGCWNATLFLNSLPMKNRAQYTACKRSTQTAQADNKADGYRIGNAPKRQWEMDRWGKGGRGQPVRWRSALPAAGFDGRLPQLPGQLKAPWR